MTKESPFQRFIDQAVADYDGTPKEVTRFEDEGGETHVIIKTEVRGQMHYLDWIGAEYAPEPDEWQDEVPPYKMRWSKIKPEHLELAQSRAAK
jgi:hypothetical protein